MITSAFEIFVAPDAAPSNIRVSSMVSISVIKLQWDKIPEDKANGIIRGYYIEYTATNLNGQNVELNERVTKTVRVRGNRDSIDLENLTPGSSYDITIFGYTIKNGTKSNLKNGRKCTLVQLYDALIVVYTVFNVDCIFALDFHSQLS